MPSLPLSGAKGTPGYIEQRHIARQQLAAYLRVYNARSDTPMGQIGNVSGNGLMLISVLPVMVDEIFEMRLKLPTSAGGLDIIDFRALSHWCRPDVSPGYFDTGFSIISSSSSISELAHLLERYFTF
ncbi:PilZ domain-containing protein [Pseudomonas saliphila]|uniref:PilZ domain-containing protein n=1 Tax=Pseudomonas saliphila TaxID=2586906 RepID=UPI00123A1507|nr:PilZ domain-containing protein [Pseudomonas saliphila]